MYGEINPRGKVNCGLLFREFHDYKVGLYFVGLILEP